MVLNIFQRRRSRFDVTSSSTLESKPATLTQASVNTDKSTHPSTPPDTGDTQSVRPESTITTPAPRTHITNLPETYSKATGSIQVPGDSVQTAHPAATETKSANLIEKVEHPGSVSNHRVVDTTTEVEAPINQTERIQQQSDTHSSQQSHVNVDVVSASRSTDSEPSGDTPNTVDPLSSDGHMSDTHPTSITSEMDNNTSCPHISQSPRTEASDTACQTLVDTSSDAKELPSTPDNAAANNPLTELEANPNKQAETIDSRTGTRAVVVLPRYRGVAHIKQEHTPVEEGEVKTPKSEAAEEKSAGTSRRRSSRIQGKETKFSAEKILKEKHLEVFRQPFLHVLLFYLLFQFCISRCS